MSKPLVSIIILNWNGQGLLAQCLPSVLAACRRVRSQIEVMVVDNGSKDESVATVQRMYPNVRLVELTENRGFGEGNNAGVREAKGDIVVLLNNDMIVDPGFLKPLLEGFKVEQEVFAVGAQIQFQDRKKRREETGKTFAYWDNGTIRYLHQEITPLDEERQYLPIMWGSGGAVAYDRRKFERLGGFRAIYSPAYYEDADLSYRAWKRGWKVLLATRSVVHHKHRATSDKRFTAVELATLNARNRFLFLWSTISSPRLFRRHLLTVVPRLLKELRREGGTAELTGFLRALPQFVKCRFLVSGERKSYRRSDEDLLASNRWKKDFLVRQKRLQILFVCPYVPCIGVHGGGARMYYLIEGLARTHDCTVLSYMDREEDRVLARPLEKFCERVILILRGQSPAEPDWFHVKPHRPVKEFANPRFKAALEAEVGSGKYDLVQFEYHHTAFLAGPVKRFNVPMIWTHHEVQHRAMQLLLRLRDRAFPSRLALRWEWMKMLNFELQVGRLFDRIITFTKQDSDALTDYDPSLPVVIHPLGVDAKYFSPRRRVKNKGQSLVFVGYFRHNPNEVGILWFCLKIWPDLKFRFGDLRLMIVGADPSPAVRRLGDNDGITVTGKVKDIRPYLASATAFIAPLISGAGMRGKILEAWALEKPVVATSVATAGLEAVNGENVLLADTPGEFVNRLILLLEDAKLQARIGKNARTTVKRFYSWPALISSHEEIYRTLLSERS